MRIDSILVTAAFMSLILAPVAAQLAGFDPGRALEENRALAKPVGMPANWSEAARLPAKADDYLRDHFGLRRLGLQVHDKLVWHVLQDSPAVQVTRGGDGVLFFNSHLANHPYSLTEQSCGIGQSATSIAPFSHDASAFLEQAQRITHNSILVVIPTKA